MSKVLVSFFKVADKMLKKNDFLKLRALKWF